MPSNVSGWQRALYIPLIILAWLAVLIIIGWLLSYLTKTILVLVFSGVLAFTLAPLASSLSRWMPRSLAIGVAYVAGAAVALGLGALVVVTAADQVGSLAQSLPQYARDAQGLLPRIANLLHPFGVTTQDLAALQQQALTAFQNAGLTVARTVISHVAGLVNTLVNLVLVVILSIYLAANGPQVAVWLRRQTPSGQRRYANLLIAIVNRVVGGYVRGMFTLATLVGTMVGVGMWVLGVPYAMLLGVLAFLMEFIPVLGVFISGVASILLALSQGWVWALVVAGYFVIVHVVEADVVGPRILGQAVGIHPATGLVALVAGTELFGVWGALFAAPLAGLLQAVATAAWLEWRGGQPQTVLRAVTERQEEQAERRVGSG